MVFSLFCHGFFKELDSKELEIHRYSLLDTINEYQWISINEYQWISINEFLDGPSMNMVPFLWAPFFGPFFGPHGAAFGPHGAKPPQWLLEMKAMIRCFRDGDLILHNRDVEFI